MVGLTYIEGRVHSDSRGWFIQYRENSKLMPSEIGICSQDSFNSYLDGDLVKFQIVESWTDLQLTPFAKIIK